MAVTFFCCCYETEVGILAGVGVSLLMFVHANMKLKLYEDQQENTVVLKVGAQAIYYPSAEQLVSKMEKITGRKRDKPDFLVLDLENVRIMDSTSAVLIKQFWFSLSSQLSGPKIQFANVGGETRRMLAKNGVVFEGETTFELVARKEEVPTNGEVAPLYPQLHQP